LGLVAAKAPLRPLRYFKDLYLKHFRRSLATHNFPGNLVKQKTLFSSDKSVSSSNGSPSVFFSKISSFLLNPGLQHFYRNSLRIIDQWKNLLTLITNQFLKHFARRDDKTQRLYYLCLKNSRVWARWKPYKLYGHDNLCVVLDNCAYKAIFIATDADGQEHFSRLVGVR
jgi:hypothetical protein